MIRYFSGKSLLILSFLLKLHLTKSAGNDWCYEADCLTGESHRGKWGTDQIGECGMSTQSPIDILTDKVEKVMEPLKLEFTQNYLEKHENWEIYNNFHSIQFQLGSMISTHPGVSVGDLKGYRLDQLHFHWGTTPTSGSEHRIDGKMYPMELHLVHSKMEFADLMEAVMSGKPDALVVLGMFFEIKGQVPNAGYSPVTDLLGTHNFHTNERVTVNGTHGAALNFTSILPADLSTLYRYTGSLTTPTCNQVVQWVVFKTPVTISEAQMEVFRTIQIPERTDGVLLAGNYREPQPLNGRKVTCYGPACNEVAGTGTAGKPESLQKLSILMIVSFISVLSFPERCFN